MKQGVNIRTLRRLAPNWYWESRREFDQTVYDGAPYDDLDSRYVVVYRVGANIMVNELGKMAPSVKLEDWLAENT